MEGLASLYLARCLPALSQFAPNTKIELVSIPQTVDLTRKEADIFLSFFNPKAISQVVGFVYRYFVY
jgi:DNA-binding transcriptional LysR family regulator